MKINTLSLLSSSWLHQDSFLLEICLQASILQGISPPNFKKKALKKFLNRKVLKPVYFDAKHFKRLVFYDVVCQCLLKEFLFKKPKSTYQILLCESKVQRLVPHIRILQDKYLSHHGGPSEIVKFTRIWNNLHRQ